MLSFTFRRVLSHPGIFSMTQRLPTRAISCNQSFAMAVQRNLTTTANSGSTAVSKPEPESNPKSTRRKTGSSPKTAGKDKKKKKAVMRLNVTEAKPPKMPGSGYAQWLRDWIPTQPKIEKKEDAQNIIKRGAQIWKELPENEKQQYREKYNALLDEYRKRVEEWRKNVDPVVLEELNRRRVVRGQNRIRGPGRPLTGYIRFLLRVRDEYPRAEEDHKTYFKAASQRASSKWKALSDAEKAEYNDPAKADLAAWRERHLAMSQAKA